jgi:ABC-type phosphate transport system substrate-binding protein
VHVRRRRFCGVVLTAPLVASLVCGVVVAAAGPAINGGGSSFASLEVDQWRFEVARSPFDLTINYVARGSFFGRQQYINGSFDFAVTDSPFTMSEADALAASGRNEYTYVPTNAAGLGFMYNLIDRPARE